MITTIKLEREMHKESEVTMDSEVLLGHCIQYNVNRMGTSTTSKY